MKTVIAAEIREEDGVETLGFHLEDQAQLAPLLDRLIEELGAAREEIAPEVKREPPQFLDQLRGPSGMPWRIGRMLDGATVLSFRHPGFGWLHFRLPDIEEFHRELSSRLDQGKMIQDGL